MKSVNKRVVSIIVCLLMLVMAFPCQIIAGAVDLSQPCDLTVNFVTGGVNASGVTFNLYKVADLVDDDEWVFESPFSGYGISIPEEPTADTWNAMTNTLMQNYSSFKSAYDATKVTAADGSVKFEGLDAGLYLVVPQNEYSYNGKVYSAAPTLVALPYRDVSSGNAADRVWQYDVEIDVKPTVVGELVDLEVVKVWKDDGYTERPTSVTIELYNGTTLYDTVYLSSLNDWRYKWEDLDAAGTWSVKEAKIADYECTITRSGNTFIVTNTCTAEEKEPEPEENLPQTGVLWWPVPYLACAGVLFMLIGMVVSRRRNGNES